MPPRLQRQPQPDYAYRPEDGSRQLRPQVQQFPAVKVASPKARILVEVDGKVLNERILNKPMLTVGRLSGNDVRIPSQRVSRLHARIHEENGAWVIEDAESLHGLAYRGQRVDRLVLRNGDRIHVAPTVVLQFVTP